MNLSRAVGGMLLAAVLLTGCQAQPAPALPAPVAAAGDTDDGIPDCVVAELPPDALEVVGDIEAGGPYDHPRNDGVTFGNREGMLPDKDAGYYREFTVETPGLNHRGARRIVTGGADERIPEHWYYTDDHYESFCEFDP